jgi:hypothetical protein
LKKRKKIGNEVKKPGEDITYKGGKI